MSVKRIKSIKRGVSWRAMFSLMTLLYVGSVLGFTLSIEREVRREQWNVAVLGFLFFVLMPTFTMWLAQSNSLQLYVKWRVEDEEAETSRQQVIYYHLGHAAALYLKEFLEVERERENAGMFADSHDELVMEYVQPGLRYLALRVKEAAEKQVLAHQARASREAESDSEHDAAVEKADTHYREAADEFYGVRDCVMNFNKGDVRGLPSLLGMGWKSAINLPYKIL